MENNLYVKLLFVGLTALGTASVNAQNQDNINSWYRGVDIRPLPPLDILHEHLPPVNIPVKQQMGNKPTAIKQRETGYFITNTDGNGNIMSQDSGANFMYLVRVALCLIIRICRFRFLAMMQPVNMNIQITFRLKNISSLRNL